MILSNYFFLTFLILNLTLIQNISCNESNELVHVPTEELTSDDDSQQSPSSEQRRIFTKDLSK